MRGQRWIWSAMGLGMSLGLLAHTPTLAASFQSSYIVEGTSDSADVRLLQQLLDNYGYGLSIDGDFGPATEAAVIAFQRSQGLATDGIVGPMTERALLGGVSRGGYNRAATYTVQAGDTLYAIAERFGVSVDALAQANNLSDPNDLSIGENLVIPGGAPSNQGSGIVATAESLIGVPYVYGGTSPSEGFDCSGFVQYVFAQNGVDLPRTAADQFDVGTPVSRADLQPGDVVFFDTGYGISHDGIYIGNDQFIDAPDTGLTVRVESLGLSYWANSYVGARRY